MGKAMPPGWARTAAESFELGLSSAMKRSPARLTKIMRSTVEAAPMKRPSSALPGRSWKKSMPTAAAPMSSSGAIRSPVVPGRFVERRCPSLGAKRPTSSAFAPNPPVATTTPRLARMKRRRPFMRSASTPRTGPSSPLRMTRSTFVPVLIETPSSRHLKRSGRM